MTFNVLRSRLTSSTASWTLAAYDLATGVERWHVFRRSRIYDSLHDVAASPDGSTVVATGGAYDAFPVGATDSRIVTVAYDAATGTERWSQIWDGNPAGTDNGVVIAFAPDGRSVYVGGITAPSPGELDYVTIAYDVADAAFNRVWHDQHVTWAIAERLEVALKGLGRTLPAEEFAELVRRHEEMEVEIRPDLIPGIAEALAEIHTRYRTCVVSDAIVSPGSALRRLLASYDLSRHFDGFAFSDEVGHAKPHRSMFDSAARQMGVAIEEMVHIGDRDHNDVKGPQKLGMKAILFIATRAADRDKTSADALCTAHLDLPGIIDRLAD